MSWVRQRCQAAPEVTSFDPGQAAGAQRPPQRQPAGAVFSGDDVDTDDFAVPVADLEHQSGGSTERVGAGVQRSCAERLDSGVEFLGL